MPIDIIVTSAINKSVRSIFIPPSQDIFYPTCLLRLYHHFALGQNGYVYSYKYSYVTITMNITFFVKMLCYAKALFKGAFASH